MKVPAKDTSGLFEPFRPCGSRLINSVVVMTRRISRNGTVTSFFGSFGRPELSGPSGLMATGKGKSSALGDPYPPTAPDLLGVLRCAVRLAPGARCSSSGPSAMRNDLETELRLPSDLAVSCRTAMLQHQMPLVGK